MNGDKNNIKTDIEITNISSKIISLLNFIKEEIIGGCSLEKNNIYLNEKIDFSKINDKLPELLEKLGINNYQIDYLSFLYNKSLIISFTEESERKYIKIFHKTNILKEIKNYVDNIFELG